KAGGLKETAECKTLNRARKLVDGEKIYILEQGENTEVISLYNQENKGKININTASKEMLMSLYGIGEVYAGKIIEYRSTKQFTTIEDIKKIEGIGDKTFDKIKDSITAE
ncbi:MAG: ComEA family DNA-binding protein, partial [Sedimentibacter sp.]